MRHKDYLRIFTDFLPKRIEQISKTIGKASIIFTSKDLINKVVRYFMLYCVLIFCFLGYYTLILYNENKNVMHLRQEELIALNYWEEVLQKHPNFPDAYYQAAVHSLRLNNKYKTSVYLDKAVLLDPAFDEAIELKKAIK